MFAIFAAIHGEDLSVSAERELYIDFVTHSERTSRVLRREPEHRPHEEDSRRDA